MVFASLLAVVLLAAAEIYVIITIAHLIGWALTLMLLIASTVAGLWLVRIQGRRAWGALRGAVASGVVPDKELGDAALILAGGALIAVPGFVTDVLGVLAVAPLTRSAMRRIFGVIFFRRAAAVGIRLGSRATRARARGRAQAAPPSQPGKTIPGEVIDDSAATGKGAS
ncbi:MAG TPA: FxsA family protein [Streptosporangiaceae bacterium]|nr:FxsA family protein [Streptosporangiaceae bacterium]